jgi:hypothetical protein
MKSYYSILLCSFLLLFFSIPGFTYSRDTHEVLNEGALNISTLIMEKYLNSHFGFLF